MKKINIDEIIPLNAFEKTHSILIDVVYAKRDHEDNHFPDLYSPEAKIMWAHKDIAAVTLRAAQICHDLYGWTLKINDCLRTIEAQEEMVVYEYDPSLVSRPGTFAHPRAMAIDVEPLDSVGNKVPMGTSFDSFAENPKLDNPAARNYTQFSDSLQDNAVIWENRQRLEFSMCSAAASLGREIHPLSQEWWDFREKEEVWGQFAPLRENDLHPFQRLIDVDAESIQRIVSGQYPEEIKATLELVKQLVARPLK